MKNNRIFLAVTFIILAISFVMLKKFYSSNQDSKANSTNSKNLHLLVKDHSPSIGSKDSPVVIVEFLDPECESCRAMAPIVDELLKEYKDKVFYALRYMPFHPGSMLAAVSLEEARDQGKFWEALHILFERQPEWGDHHSPKPELIAVYLKELGIKPESLEQELLLKKHKWKVDLDQEDGIKLGIKNTPTFFVNGTKLEQLGYESLKNAIESELSQNK